MSHNPIIYTIANQKGGVGKSTTALNLSDALGRKRLVGMGDIGLVGKSL